MTPLVLKIYAIPVRVFPEPMSGFSASSFRETPNSRLRPAGAMSSRCHSGASSTVYSIKNRIECLGFAGDDHGRSGARSNAWRQLFDHAHSTLPPAWHPPDHVGVCEKYQRDRYYVCRSWCASAPTPLLVKFFRSTHSRAS